MFVFMTQHSQEWRQEYINTSIAEVTTVENDVTALLQDTYKIENVSFTENSIREIEDVYSMTIDSLFITDNKMDSVKRTKFFEDVKTILNDKVEEVNNINYFITQHNRLIARYPTKWALPNKTQLSHFQL